MDLLWSRIFPKLNISSLFLFSWSNIRILFFSIEVIIIISHQSASNIQRDLVTNATD